MVMQLVSQFSGNNSLIVWDVIHRCLGYSIGMTDDHNDAVYCINNDLIQSYGTFSYFLFSFLNEPINFAVDWDIFNEESEVLHLPYNQHDYYHLLDFHRKNCLKTEKIYNHNVEQSYFEWKESNQTILTVTKGLATVSARKIHPNCKPQPL